MLTDIATDLKPQFLRVLGKANQCTHQYDLLLVLSYKYFLPSTQSSNFEHLSSVYRLCSYFTEKKKQMKHIETPLSYHPNFFFTRTHFKKSQIKLNKKIFIRFRTLYLLILPLISYGNTSCIYFIINFFSHNGYFLLVLKNASIAF